MQNSRSDILLIGMPMSGKTVIGRALSERMKFKFSDMDSIIEVKKNQSIDNIFRNQGEEIFRIYEKECFEDLLNKNSHVLSVGGGAINSLTLEISLTFRYRIWLKASISCLIERYGKKEKNRPLLYNTNNIRESISDLYNARKHFYKNCSNIIIDTTEKSIVQIINESIIKIDELN